MQPKTRSPVSARNLLICAISYRLLWNATRKKYALQMRQLSDTEDRDKYKVYGELIHTYGYNLEPGAKVLDSFELLQQ